MLASLLSYPMYYPIEAAIILASFAAALVRVLRNPTGFSLGSVLLPLAGGFFAMLIFSLRTLAVLRAGEPHIVMVRLTENSIPASWAIACSAVILSLQLVRWLRNRRSLSATRNTKNIQVIDGATNCAYSIYPMNSADFAKVFPGPGQDVEFIDDLMDRLGETEAIRILSPIWGHRVDKPQVQGIHGTLFYGLEVKRAFYPNKRETDFDDGELQKQAATRLSPPRESEN